ncbi:MAG: hypothetical protein VX589_21135 [Myxococcota bacterium]|nr:hypothetical protein [Myxococcota bacterium]
MEQTARRRSIAVVTCQGLPDWEVDDHHLYRALDQSGVQWSLVAWDDSEVEWAHFGLVLLRTPWDYTDRSDVFRDWVRRVGDLGTLTNPSEVVLWNLNKTYLASLEQAGIPIAPSRWVARGAPIDLAQLIDEAGWSRAFIKPQIGATARLTMPFSRDNVREAQAFIDEHAAREGMIIQPYLESVEREGELSLIYFGGVLSHCVRKVPVEGDYRVQDDFGARDFPVDAEIEAVRIGEKALSAAERICGISTPLAYGRVDFLRGPRGEYFLNELELVEPSLFFRHRPAAAEQLVAVCLSRMVG